MHIPDGYLSPQTNAVLGLASAVVAAAAVRNTSQHLKAKLVPMISLGAAFSFTLMMFNIPIPDGTTAHATGGALLAVLLGPWSAMIALSVALVIQAFFFGDGGILALGANIFNVAFVLPFVSYGVYRLISGHPGSSDKRRILSAGIAGFVGLNAAALLTGFEFGIQPLLFQSANGVPLYSPYGLNIAIPAMAFGHVLIAGPIEGVITALIISHLLRTNPTLFQTPGWGEPTKSNSSSHPLRKNPLKKAILTLSFLVLLTPLGLLASGTAWGEWGVEEIQSQLGFIPTGMENASSFWQSSIFSDYAVSGLETTFWQQALGYLLSAFLGLGVIALIGFILYKIFLRAEGSHESTPLASRKR